MTWTVGDTSPDLTGICKKQVGTTTTPAPITGATLVLHIKKPSGTVITKAATIVSGPDGSWSCTWATNDLDVDGKWVYENQVTYSNGQIQTFGPDEFVVQPQIG